MVNSTLTSTPNRGVSLRKTNKPLMEKRRRARINDSLSQLKSLVIHSSKKDSSQFSKLEKADILELTVKHLRGLQAQQQQQQQLQQQHHHMSVQPVPNGAADTLMNGKYRAGFVECANEVIRYLDQSQGLNQETKTKVVSHLAGCLQLVSNVNNGHSNPNHSHPHNHSHQSKIAPQPVPVPAQTQQAPPANAAAILAAAAAAAGNTNSTTTTTQLPNGQIIQIVSNPLQNAQPAPSQAVLGVNPSAPTTISSQPAVQNPPAAIKPIPQQSTPNPAYVHYAQPLHIQIPPIVSPVLIKKESHPQTQQQLPPQHQPKHIEPSRESRNNFSSSSSSISSHSHSTSSSLPDQVNDIVSSSTALAPSPPLPQQRVSTTPPSSLYPGHPKARAQKQLNFFTQQEINKSSSINNSRIAKSTVLTPPSSSGSSSESENTSPLNLSQSPPYSAYHQHRPKSDHHHHQQQRRHFFPAESHNIQEQQKQSMYLKPTSLLGENLAFKDANNNISYAPNVTSVIVNSKKCADFSDGKYWSMMEEERHCTRHQNTPSPASSVGEERLWRPW